MYAVLETGSKQYRVTAGDTLAVMPSPIDNSPCTIYEALSWGLPFLAARTGGVPEVPRAWIIQTAKHKAIDRIRRQQRYQQKLQTYSSSGFAREIEEPDYGASEDWTE